MNNVGKAALLGGVALLLAGGKTSDRSANVPALAAQPNNQIDANTLYDIFLNNPDLQKLFKGAKGEQGEQGIQGIPGVSGDWLPQYGNSMLRNGALESGAPNFWTGTSLTVASALHDGMPVLESPLANNTTDIYLLTDKLYKIEYFVKGTTGNHSILLNLYKKDGTAAPKTDASTGAYGKFNLAMPTNFTKVTGYIGGVGTNVMNVSANTVKGRLSFQGHSGVVVSIAKLVVTEVSLGEPVPYNLAYLPKWQTVYDPTTGDLGIFNGTAVVWAS